MRAPADDEAISPVMVYFSRFIRDDIFLACFSLILFVCAVHYLEKPRPILLYAGAATLALAPGLFAADLGRPARFGALEVASVESARSQAASTASRSPISE